MSLVWSLISVVYMLESRGLHELSEMCALATCSLG